MKNQPHAENLEYRQSTEKIKIATKDVFINAKITYKNNF